MIAVSFLNAWDIKRACKPTWESPISPSISAFGKGISREGDVLDLAADANIVEKSGSWYAYKGAKIGQGRENAKNYLLQNPLICEEIENQVRELHGLEAQHVVPGEMAAETAPKETLAAETEADE